MFFKQRFSKRSYSQCGEDLIVKFYFDNKGIQKITYLDIGANHPFIYNNTALFYLDGCRGVNIEPDPNLYSLLVKHRKKDIHLNIAIDSKEGEVDFFLFKEHTMNTISKIEAEKNIKERNFHFEKSIKIKTQTLSSIIDENFNGKYPDFLTIDAEGIDEHIIQSLDDSKDLPKVICIETIGYTSNLSGIKNSAIFTILKEKNYRVFADTYVNTVFVRE
jgi:FkbM family methyltransferase